MDDWVSGGKCGAGDICMATIDELRLRETKHEHDCTWIEGDKLLTSLRTENSVAMLVVELGGVCKKWWFGGAVEIGTNGGGEGIICMVDLTGAGESVYVLPLESNGGVNIIGLKIGTEVFDAGSIGETTAGG